MTDDAFPASQALDAISNSNFNFARQIITNFGTASPVSPVHTHNLLDQYSMDS